MALVNSSVEDITPDTLLSQSKSKIKGNDDKLLANDVAIDGRITTVEGGSFVGTARWNDIIIPGTALAPGASAPDLTAFATNIYLYSFDGGSTTEEVFGTFEIPHDYKEGTDIRPHIHWAPINGNSGNVRWVFEYTKASKDGTFSSSTTIIYATGAATGALKHLANEFTTISGTGMKIGDIVAFSLSRVPVDVNDTYGSDAFLLSLGVHYQIDSTGSVNIFTKT